MFGNLLENLLNIGILFGMVGTSQATASDECVSQPPISLICKGLIFISPWTLA